MILPIRHHHCTRGDRAKDVVKVQSQDSIPDVAQESRVNSRETWDSLAASFNDLTQDASREHADCGERDVSPLPRLRLTDPNATALRRAETNWAARTRGCIYYIIRIQQTWGILNECFQTASLQSWKDLCT